MDNRVAADELECLGRKLHHTRINQTLAFSALFQLVHEAIKFQVLDRTKSFFGYSDLLGDGVWITGESGERDYASSVLALSSKPFNASLKWLEDRGAITAEDITQLKMVYTHRHDLTHELSKYLVDVDHEPNTGLLVNALKILRRISKFWTQVEVDSGSFKHLGEVSEDDAVPLHLIFIQMCVDAYLKMHKE